MGCRSCWGCRGGAASGRWHSRRGRQVQAPCGPIVVAGQDQGVILGSLHGHAGQREVGATRGAGGFPRRTPKVEGPGSNQYRQRGPKGGHMVGWTHVRLEGSDPAPMSPIGLPLSQSVLPAATKRTHTVSRSRRQCTCALVTGAPGTKHMSTWSAGAVVNAETCHALTSRLRAPRRPRSP